MRLRLGGLLAATALVAFSAGALAQDGYGYLFSFGVDC